MILTLNSYHVTVLNKLIALRPKSDFYGKLVGMCIGKNYMVPQEVAEIFAQEVLAMEKLISENPDVHDEQKAIWAQELRAFKELLKQVEK